MCLLYFYRCQTWAKHIPETGVRAFPPTPRWYCVMDGAPTFVHCLMNLHRNADRIARFNTTIRTADAGKSSKAFLSRLGSPPAMAPMIHELTARPTHPQVMTKPNAVPVMRGNAAPVMASVVGKTGAIDRPAMKTKTNAIPGLFVCNIRKVVMAMAMDAPSVTSIGDT